MARVAKISSFESRVVGKNDHRLKLSLARSIGDKLMRCKVCDSELTLRKKYNEHVAVLSLKTLIKKLLPFFDFIIPGFIPKFKRYSSKKSPFRAFRGHISVCSNCGYGVMENPPTKIELQRYYQEEYWSQRSTAVEKATVRDNEYKHDPRAIHQVDFAKEEIHCGTISNVLEIGAGAAYGSLLLRNRCKDSTINLYVCEPGAQWEDYYQRQGTKKIADNFPFETSERFDFVHTSHWLDHTQDLDETLSYLNTIINPSGYIFVEVHNTEHFYWDLPTMDIPHIHFFTRRSLVKAFENHKFDCLKIGEYGITYLDRQNGISVTPDKYGACDKGFWIRGLFKKAS